MSAAAPFARQEFRMSTDTVVGIPSARPVPPTVELFLPLKPVLTGRAVYVRRSRRTRLTRFIQANGWAAASGISTCVVAGYVVVQALGGGL